MPRASRRSIWPRGSLELAEKLIFEKSVPGRRAVSLPEAGEEIAALIPKKFLRADPPRLPELGQPDLVRHFTALSTQNYGIDTGFYPLGSCTMKYNPKINEDVAQLPGLSGLHPLAGEDSTQGALRLIWELERMLSEIAGMARVSLQPAAGAQGELCGLLMIHSYFDDKREKRRKVLIPDSAHGTNPASAAIAGYSVEVVPSNRRGTIDVDELARRVDRETAALMLTNPNTLGLFETEIEQIMRLLHEAGALAYLDGANMNALLGLARPGDMGFDIVHFNLHKTFSTPHGGGGPGAGAVGVTETFAPYLPAPIVDRPADDKENFFFATPPRSIGRLHGFYGNFGMLVRAYAYLRAMGGDGLAAISRNAIINANYLKKRLAGAYPIPQDRPCMHEFVLSGRFEGIHAWDIAKRLIDYGVYPPTVNFPLIVEEALMIESPESESRETLDRFAEAMLAIRREITESPDKVRNAPEGGRMDEVRAARQLDVRYLFR